MLVSIVVTFQADLWTAKMRAAHLNDRDLLQVKPIERIMAATTDFVASIND